MIREAFTTAIAASLVTAPVAAQAAERRASPAQSHEKLGGYSWLPWVLAAAVILAVIVLVADDNNTPESP